jgi:thiol-disulfide isomerase/thioredoxin
MRFYHLMLVMFVSLLMATPVALGQRRKQLSVGDPAPGLDVAEWVKGEFDPAEAEVYVVEFWATWCGPCKKSIPHLTELQETYGQDGLSIIGITSEDLEIVEPFVRKQGSNMEYAVGIDHRGATERAWMKAAGKNGIHTAFVVDRGGSIQFIGHPLSEEFESVLAKVMTGRYDQAKEEKARPLIEAARRNLKGRNWQQADLQFEEARKIDPVIFADLYIEQFKSMLLHRGEPEMAYLWATGVLKDRQQDDPELLTWFADTVVNDPDIPDANRDLDFALLAALRAMENAKREGDPKYLSVMATVKFHRGEIEEAIAFQKKAYFAASELKKPPYKQALDNYRRQMQRQAVSSQ